jgi:hypothetical protein
MADKTIAADAHVRKHLEQINLHLQVVYSGIILSADALRYQNCERDEDVAYVLIHCLSERLAIQMERIAEIAAQFSSRESESDEIQEDPDPRCH